MNAVLTILRRTRDLFPFTWLGLLVAGGSALALFYFGLSRIDLLLLVVGIVGLGLVAIAFLLVAFTALVLWLKVRKRKSEQALQLECAFPRRTGFSFGTPWFVPFVRIGWSWLDPEVHLALKKHGLRMHEEIAPMRRAMRDSIVRRFEVSDVFGLSTIAFVATELRPVRFTPTIGNLRQVHVIRSLAEGDQLTHPDGPPQGERVDMRQYVPGDPIRFVLWKVFAKSRQVVVRTPERAFGPVHQTVAYLVCGERDEPAAGAARVALESGAMGGDWVLGADGCPEPATTQNQAIEVLARSGETPVEDGGKGLKDFLETAVPGGNLGRALVFVPSTPGPWLDRVLAVAARGQMGPPVEFMVVADGIDRRTRGAMSKLAYRHEEKIDPRKGIGMTSAEDLAEVVRRLSSIRARVTILDRVTGAAYGAAHQASLLGARPEKKKAPAKKGSVAA